MAQVNHGGGHRVEQPVKVKNGFHVGARQYQHDDPLLRRREPGGACLAPAADRPPGKPG
jgi:hypothetical protein